MVIKSAINGLDLAARNWRMTLVVYAANLFVMLLVVLALKATLFGELELRGVSDQMLEGLDITLLADFSYARANLSQYVGVGLSLLFAYTLGSVLLSGGVWGTLRRSYLEHEEYQEKFSLRKFFSDEFSVAVFLSEKFSLQYFFSDCGRYVKSFFKLFLLFIALLVLPLAVLIVGIVAGATAGAVTEVPATLLTLSGIFGALVLFAYLQMSFDYARLKIIDGERGAWRAVRWGVGLVLRKLRIVSGLFLFYTAILAIITFLYFKVVFVIDIRHGHEVLAMFIFQQLYVLGKIVVRHSLLASEICFSESLPAPLPVSPKRAAVKSVKPVSAFPTVLPATGDARQPQPTETPEQAAVPVFAAEAGVAKAFALETNETSERQKSERQKTNETPEADEGVKGGLKKEKSPEDDASLDDFRNFP
ncbi:MAG: hypothetical protein IAF08_02470 [Rhizobacter sp.]|nr:hypothetical protein [Chlorobiales bacterium]